MAIISTSRHVAQRDGASRAYDLHTRLIDRVLGALEIWIGMRTRRERGRLDAVMARNANTALPQMHARGQWWRSWRASTRRRDWLL